MQYMRGWRALRQDPEGMKKLGLASLLLLSGAVIPIVGQLVVVGWLTLAVRRAVQGQDAPLPDLRFDMDYMMKLMGVGAKAFLARLVWMLPAIMVVVLGAMCAGAGMSVAVRASASSGEPPSSVVLLIMGGIYLFAFAVFFVVQIFANVAVMRAELMGDLGPAIRIGEVMRTTRMLAKELIVGHIVLGLIGFALTIVGLMLCYFGAFPAMAILMVIGSYYNAELYRRYLEKGGQPLAIAALEVEPKAGTAPPAPSAF